MSKQVNNIYSQEEVLKLIEENRLLKEELASYKNSENIDSKELNVKPLDNEQTKIKSAFTNAPAAICLLKGPKHIFEFVNNDYYKLYGYRKLMGLEIRTALPEIEGQGFFELLDDVYQNCKPFIGNEMPAMVDNKNNGILELRYFNIVYQPLFDANNKVDGIMVFAFDTTKQVLARQEVEKLNNDLIRSEAEYKELAESLELQVRKRTEELILSNKETEYQRNKLSSLFMNSPAFICLLKGPEHIFELSNPMYQKITGNRNIVGLPVRKALPEVEGQGFFELLDDVYNTGKPFIGNEVPIMLDNGDSILNQAYLNFVYQPIYSIENKIEGISVFGFEVTDLVIAQKQTEHLAESLRHSNDELKRFAYVASHDLQEPLRTITSYTELLARRYKDKIDDSANNYIKLVVEGSKRMKNLIESLLEYSKVGTQEISLKLIDCNKIIDNVSDNLKALISERNVKLNYSNLPIIKVDQIQFNQLFQNIITNAIKYNESDQVLININAYKSENQIIFSIDDNGIGIKSEDINKLFQVFKRLHTKDEYPGTGIGLSICKKIIERHNGKIWIESEQNKGTTFYFSLPN